jgi:MFS family permease
MVALFWVTSWPSIFVIRLLDRGGKGIAEAPRDALVSGSAEKGHVGKAFGLTRMFDNAGAVIGLVLASGIVWYTSRNASALSVPLFHSIVLLSVIPLLCNILILALLVHDVPIKREKISGEKRTGLARKFYYFLILSVIFTIGNSSDAFIILQSQRIGLSVWMIFLLLAGYSFVSSISAVPLSSLSDRIGRKKLLIIGWMYYAVMYYAFALVKTPLSISVVILLYGAYYGFTEGSAKAYIADLVPQPSRGTAYGMYNMATGIALLCASVIAGYLWQAIAPEAAFYFGSISAIIAGIGLFFVSR